MKSPAGVMAVVLAEMAAGGACFLFATPLWNEVRRGFFYLAGGILAVLSASAAGAATAGFRADAAGGALGTWLALALALGTVVWVVLIRARIPNAARVFAFATLPIALAMLAAFASALDEEFAVATFQLVAGALFTGAALDGLLLGHWYLTDRKLPRGPINRIAWLLVASVAVEIAAILAGGSSEAAQSRSISPLLTLAGNSTLVAVGMVALAGIVAFMIRLALREPRSSAVQAATGFFWIAAIVAFVGEFAAKVRFVP